MSEMWDPLDTDLAGDPSFVAAARRREIRNILKSYVGFYDPFAEAIQNAMDAVDKRQRVAAEEGYQKRLWITINLKENVFRITDNGIGFKEQEFRSFLCPNVSFKEGEVNRGRKGVGATYLAYGFNYLQVGTKVPDYKALIELKDGRRWVDDDKSNVIRPRVALSSAPHPPFTCVDRGSTFTLRVGGGNTRPSDLSWIGATTAEQWKTILLIKTPLGQISFPGTSESPILFDLEVIDRNGGTSSLEKQACGYIFPHLAIPVSAHLKDILEEQARRLAKGLDASKLPEKYKHLNAIYQFWNTEELADLLPGRTTDAGYQEQVQLLKTVSARMYSFFCYSTKIWDAFNDDKAKLRRGLRILHGGLQLGADRMPQGEVITIPLTSNIGYQNQAHIIVHFSNAEPDLGRKGFQPEVQGLAQDLAVGAVNNLKKWRHLLKKDSGAIVGIVEKTALHNWIKDQEAHQAAHPLKISNPNFFAPVHEVSILSVPQSEQDVIVLFNQLIAGGVIRGLRLMATSQHDQYDGVFRYCATEPLENHRYDKTKNPLGVPELTYQEGFSSSPLVLEYKFNLDALIQEFANGEKNDKDIELAIVWETGQEWKKHYAITSLLDPDNLHLRTVHGLTHLVKDDASGDRRFALVVLSELIQYLEDRDTTYSIQRERYGDNE
jgi:hypothetical protein